MYNYLGPNTISKHPNTTTQLASSDAHITATTPVNRTVLVTLEGKQNCVVKYMYIRATIDEHEPFGYSKSQLLWQMAERNDTTQLVYKLVMSALTPFNQAIARGGKRHECSVPSQTHSSKAEGASEVARSFE